MRAWIDRLHRKHPPEKPRADWKQAAMQDFAAWLDEIDEPPVVPEDGESPYGLSDLIDAMTALRTETGNLARNAGRALREGEELRQSLAAEREQDAETRAAERQEWKRAMATVEGLSRLQDVERERTGRRRALQMLFEALENIRAVRERFAAPIKRGWFTRAAAVPSADKDFALLIKTLETALETWNVRELVAVGDPFDPRTMRAIGSVKTGRVPPGAVCDVIRQGIMIDDQVERYAEVNVEKDAE